MKSTVDFSSLFINDVPLIDVRAPIEFHEGHFPTSTNLYLMDNEERRQVGTRYKQLGQKAAIDLGHELVCGPIKEERIDRWVNFIQKNPKARLYCFRGGLRSEISTSWIKERGVNIEFIPGGYKALRQYLLGTIETETTQRKYLIVGGRTGNGKTPFLKASGAPYIDLEKAANHKGSSFGILGPQPAQITFENRIAIDFLKNPNHRFTLLEDESVMIGSAIVPRSIINQILGSPLLILEKKFEDRVEHIIHDYVFSKNRDHSGNTQQTYEFMLAALGRIEKKLGGLRAKNLREELEKAFHEKDPTLPDSHEAWVAGLLKEYYDPLYDRSIQKNESRIIFRGNEAECLDFIRTWNP